MGPHGRNGCHYIETEVAVKEANFMVYFLLRVGMGRHYLLVTFVFLTFLLIQPLQDVFAGQGVQASLDQAARYGKEGKLDFAFMELRNLLRTYPEGPHVPEVEFALGEYFFLQRNPREAKAAFLRCLPEIPFDSVPRFLCQIYLLKCEEDSPGSKVPPLLTQLKQQLSSQRFFQAFDDKRTRTWESPLGTSYTLNEFVNRVEILQNGQTF